MNEVEERGVVCGLICIAGCLVCVADAAIVVADAVTGGAALTSNAQR